MNAIDLNDIDMTPAPAPADPNAATDKQINFINALIEQADDSTLPVQNHLAGVRKILEEGIDKRAASFIIDGLKGLPRKPREEKPETPEGMHRYDGVIYKVQRAVHGSGRTYAKALRSYFGDWTFEYAPGAIKNLSEDTLLTLDEAKEFGVLTGTCAVCARTLTNEESIAAGIGPVCAKRW